MERDLRELLKYSCFGYMREKEKEDSYTVTLICEVRFGYMSPKSKQKKVENLENDIKRILTENGYDTISVKGYCAESKGSSFTYNRISDDVESHFSHDVPGNKWLYEFTVNITIKKPEPEVEIIESIEDKNLVIESSGLTYDSMDDVPDPDKPSGMSDRKYKSMMTAAYECPVATSYYKGVPIRTTGTYYNPNKKSYRIITGFDANGDWTYVKRKDDPTKTLYFHSLTDVKEYINKFMLKNTFIEGFNNKDSSNSEKINNFIEDLYDLRKESIDNEGEYGLGNLVFKEFRNLGYLDNLKELKNQEKSKELSLEDDNMCQ